MIHIIKKIEDTLHRPAFFFRRPQYVISLNVVLSTLMMIMYQPFGYRLDHVSQLFELFGFILIALVYSLLFFKIIPSYFRKSSQYIRWTIGKNIIYLSTFLLITGLNIFLYDFHIVSGYSFPDYGGSYFAERMLVDVCGVFSIGIFPLYVSYLLEKNYYLKRNLDVLDYSSYGGEKRTGEKYIMLKGDTKDFLEVFPGKIEYIESSGNYVNIYYNEGTLERKTIRTTIKKIEEQLSGYSFFVRCHRAYIVNLNYVVKFGRNNIGYRVSLDGCEDDIPVSRTYLSNVKDLLNKS